MACNPCDKREGICVYPTNGSASFQTLSMTQQQEALQLAKRYKEVLRKAGIPFTKFIVFGSTARNEMHEQSDIDIAVVGTPFGIDRLQEMHEVRKLRRPLSYKLQPIWFYPEHLEDTYSTLAQEIKKDGLAV